MSTHRIPVVKVHLERHPNADTLSIVHVGGWQVVVKTTDWKEGVLAAYVPPDYVVPEKPEFEWLRPHCRVVDAKVQDEQSWMRGFRIKTKRFRGEWSQGLLLPVSEGQENDDVMTPMGIGHYDPPLDASQAGDAEGAPDIPIPVYDVESWQNFPTLLQPEEEVLMTEKIHGANGRWVWWNDRLWCGSHKQWKQDRPSSIWWRAARETPGLIDWLKAHPGIILYGEVYGSVQDLKYGMHPGEIKVALFDVLNAGQWLPNDEARTLTAGLPWVPILYRGPFDSAKAKALADGPSTVPGANHFREGIVIKPVAERTCPEIGRVQLKMVSSAYLERA